MHQQAGHALQREAQGLHTWHEKLLNAHIACRASADAAPLSGRNSLCADGAVRAAERACMAIVPAELKAKGVEATQ